MNVINFYVNNVFIVFDYCCFCNIVKDMGIEDILVIMKDLRVILFVIIDGGGNEMFFYLKGYF